jgi:predicted membrane metal-binding protein
MSANISTKDDMTSAKPRQFEGVVAWLPLAIAPLSVLVLYHQLQPWTLMWSLAVSIFLGLKWLTWCRVRGRTPHAS